MRIIPFLVLASLLLAPFQVHAAEAPRSDAYEASPASPGWEFVVHIISGTRSGQTWKGSFAISDQELPRLEEDVTLETQNFQFHYADQDFKAKDMDGVPKVRFVHGQPVEILGTGGPRQLRFGFSAGFERGQFGRVNEQFIADKYPYFGYLDPDTYVDGAGIMVFTPAASRPRGP